MELVISVLLSIVGIYLLIGVIAYFPLMRKGIPTFDDSMGHTPIAFKILIFPGVVVFWLPLFLKWKKK